ncbi:MAG: hypothetical protein LBI38_03870, partial [Oscillospiraceae bacterium]|nr:hypothetical protein [Oscillospiraceae bacterium]
AQVACPPHTSSFAFPFLSPPLILPYFDERVKRVFRGCLKYTRVVQDERAKQLSGLYFEVGGLPPKSKEDAAHIAIASVYDCDVILSWNFKHIVNLRAMTAVETVNFQMRYKNIRILSPSMLLSEEE